MKVIIAIDESQHTEQAIAWYLDHHRDGNEVVLVHVSELPMNQSVDFATAIAIPRAQWDEMFESCRKLFEKLQTRLSPFFVNKGISHKFIRAEGQPGPTICDLAKSQKAQLVVMGTRGMGRIRRTFLGSVSDYVLHHCHSPVTVCRK